MNRKILECNHELVHLIHSIRSKMKLNFNELGYSPSQFFVIKKLQPNEVITTTQLSNKLIKKNSNLTPIIDSLVKKNIIERVYDESDRRLIKLKLTDEGVKIREKMIKSHEEYICYLYKNFDDKDINKIEEVIEIIKNKLK